MKRLSLGLTALAAVAVTTALLAGCATRTVPLHPHTSAASPHGVEAPATPVAVSLASDPPLPGETTGAWSGLHDTTPFVADAPRPHAPPAPPPGVHHETHAAQRLPSREGARHAH